MSIPPQVSGGFAPEKRWEPEALLLIAWQRKGLLLLGAILGVALGAGVAMLLPRVYQSTALVSIVKKRPDTVTGIDTRHLSAEEQISPAQDLLKSSLIVERAIRSKGLDGLPSYAQDDSDLVEKMKLAFQVIPGRTTSGGNPSPVFKLQFRARDANDSLTVLTALLDSFRDYMEKKHQAISEDTVELILRDKQALEKEMAEKETAYKTFREKAPLLSKGKDSVELRQERLNSIQTKRSALLLQRVEIEGQLATLEMAQKEGRGPDAMLALLAEFARKGDGSEIGRDKQAVLQDQLFPLLLEERKLVQIHGAKHPEVVEIRKRIEIAQRLLVLPPTAWCSETENVREGSPRKLDPVSLHVQLLKQKLHHNKVSEELLVNIFKTEQDEARRLATFEIENDSYLTSLGLNQKLYEALVKRLNEVSLIRDVGGYHIELLEPPLLGKLVAPRMDLALIIGAVLGLLLGFGFAYWRDFRDTRFRSKNEVTHSLGLNVLGTIPRSTSAARKPAGAKGSLSESEAFWKIRNILALMAEKNGPRVIQVTGPSGSEGSSTVAANLSAALAQAGKSVLLIDANPKASNAHRLLGLPVEAAVAATLSPKTNLEPAPVTGLAGLGVVSLGAGNQSLPDLLNKERARYEFIVIDSPALLTDASASTMMRSADAAILTIDYTRTTRPQAERATQLLVSAGVKTLGVVINGMTE